MYEIKDVSPSLIDPNLHRDLKTYPWIERKVEQLMHSINDVGLWASMIARPQGKRYQLAFGHHRLEAAERLKLKAIPLIIRQLSDREMLRFMGRENGEDYSTDFLIMLNTWEGAVKFLDNSSESTKLRATAPKPLDIAIELGWTRLMPDREDEPRLSTLASACAAAYALIKGGYMSRSDLRGLSVSAAEDIVTRAQHRIQQVADIGAKNKASFQDIERHKQHIGKAAATTALEHKKGEVAQRDLRGRVDVNAYRYARDSGRVTPLFAAFGKSVIEQIERMLNTDGVAEKLTEIRGALPDITENEDRQAVQRIELALEQLGDRTIDWRKKLMHPAKKVVPLTPIIGKGA